MERSLSVRRDQIASESTPNVAATSATPRLNTLRHHSSWDRQVVVPLRFASVVSRNFVIGRIGVDCMTVGAGILKKQYYRGIEPAGKDLRIEGRIDPCKPWTVCVRRVVGEASAH